MSWSALRRRIGDQLARFLNASLSIEEDRCRLHHGHAYFRKCIAHLPAPITLAFAWKRVSYRRGIRRLTFVRMPRVCPWCHMQQL